MNFPGEIANVRLNFEYLILSNIFYIYRPKQNYNNLHWLCGNFFFIISSFLVFVILTLIIYFCLHFAICYMFAMHNKFPFCHIYHIVFILAYRGSNWIEEKISLKYQPTIKLLRVSTIHVVIVHVVIPV